MGLLALGESMPMSLGMQALRLLSWASITLGVSALAGGKGVHRHGMAPGYVMPAVNRSSWTLCFAYIYWHTQHSYCSTLSQFDISQL